MLETKDTAQHKIGRLWFKLHSVFNVVALIRRLTRDDTPAAQQQQQQRKNFGQLKTESRTIPASQRTNTLPPLGQLLFWQRNIVIVVCVAKNHARMRQSIGILFFLIPLLADRCSCDCFFVYYFFHLCVVYAAHLNRHICCYFSSLLSPSLCLSLFYSFSWVMSYNEHLSNLQCVNRTKNAFSFIEELEQLHSRIVVITRDTAALHNAHAHIWQ